MRIWFMSMFSLLTFALSDCNPSSSKLSSSPCFSDRESIEEIVELKLECRRAGDLVVLSAENGNRYAVCNNEENSLGFEIGKEYKISGKIYPAKANERWPGAPLEVHSMSGK